MKALRPAVQQFGRTAKKLFCRGKISDSRKEQCRLFFRYDLQNISFLWEKKKTINDFQDTEPEPEQKPTRTAISADSWTMTKTAEGTLYTLDGDPCSRSCLIRHDLTLEVNKKIKKGKGKILLFLIYLKQIRANNLIAKLPEIERATSADETFKILSKVAAARLCRGVKAGYNCPNILFLPHARGNRFCVCCPSCGTKIRKKLKNECKKKKRLLARRKRTIGLKKNVKRKLIRSRKKESIRYLAQNSF